VVDKFAPLLKGKDARNKSAWEWGIPLFEAMREQADTIFLLSANHWGDLYYVISEGKDWNPSAKKRWEDAYKEGLKKLEEENKKRVAAGKPPRVLDVNSRYAINGVYNPDIEKPPESEKYFYVPRDFAHDLSALRAQERENKSPTTLGLRGKRKKKEKFTVNIILFLPKDGVADAQSAKSLAKFKQLASLTGGQYRSIKGLEAIESASYSSESRKKGSKK
jgi:hypothetical protein